METTDSLLLNVLTTHASLPVTSAQHELRPETSTPAETSTSAVAADNYMTMPQGY
jgi:hypothetical protein